MKRFALGVSKDLSHQVLGSRWTLKIYKEDELWGVYLKCWHIPSLNMWTSFAVGEEKCMDHEVLGKMKVFTFLYWG